MKIGAEMYIWSEFLKKYGNINFKHNWHNSKENIELSKLTLANNVIILDRDQFEFNTPEHIYLFNPVYSWTWIDHHLWKLYYYNFCVPYDKNKANIYLEYKKICNKQYRKMLLNRFSIFKKKYFPCSIFREFQTKTLYKVYLKPQSLLLQIANFKTSLYLPNIIKELTY